MSNKINYVKEPFSVEVKRFYFPCSLESPCPKCGDVKTMTMANEYISYPVINGVEEVSFGCEPCGEEGYTEWKVRIRLDLNVTLD